MTNQEFMTWIENFLVDVQWTPTLKKKILYMVNGLDSRTHYVEKHQVIVKREIIYVTKDEAPKTRPDLDEIAIDTCQKYKITVKDLVSKNRKYNLVCARAEMCKIARLHGYTLVEIGLFLHRDHTTMMHYLYRRKDQTPELSNLWHGRANTVRVEGDPGATGEAGAAGEDTGGVVRTLDAPEVQSAVQRGYETDEQITEKLTFNAM